MFETFKEFENECYGAQNFGPPPKFWLFREIYKAVSRTREIKHPKKRAQVAATGVGTAATFGHQGQGISPKRMKVLRAIAGGHFGKLSFGSLDLDFDLI